MDIYKQGLIKKLRFDSVKGKESLDMEDIFDVPVECRKEDAKFSLDKMAMDLDKLLEKNEGKSRVKKRNVKDRLNTLRLRIIEDVIETKLKEAEAKEQAAISDEEKQRALELLGERKKAKMGDMSDEDLLKIANG